MFILDIFTAGICAQKACLNANAERRNLEKGKAQTRNLILIGMIITSELGKYK